MASDVSDWGYEDRLRIPYHQSRTCKLRSRDLT
jgi:hypothetical protein